MLAKIQLKIHFKGVIQMKDIIEILKDNGIEIEDGKQTEIRKALAENYKTINEHNKKVEKLTEQVNTANETITDLKGKLEDAKKRVFITQIRYEHSIWSR
jgi:uncharacterized protein YpiB (UPF0302 family)